MRTQREPFVKAVYMHLSVQQRQHRARAAYLYAMWTTSGLAVFLRRAENCECGKRGRRARALGSGTCFSMALMTKLMEIIKAMNTCTLVPLYIERTWARTQHAQPIQERQAYIVKTLHCPKYFCTRAGRTQRRVVL